jgi:hypothetical protein
MTALPYVASMLPPLKRQIRIAYLYVLMWSAKRGIEGRKEGIEDMRKSIKKDEAQNLADGEYVDDLSKQIDRLEREQ